MSKLQGRAVRPCQYAGRAVAAAIPFAYQENLRAPRGFYGIIIQHDRRWFLRASDSHCQFALCEFDFVWRANLHISRPGRRVRGPGLQEWVWGTCRPRALTRRAVGVSIDV